MRYHRVLSLLAALFISACLASDVPSPDDFQRRINSRVGVINNQLYLDGGIVSETGVDGSYQVNDTLSVDLSTSWAPQDASFRTTYKASKGIPSLWKHGMFIDDAASAFYLWGGRYYFLSDPPPSKLWKFTANKNGGGDWTTEEPDSSFKSMKRSESGAYTSSKDAGFWFGGLGLPQTNEGLSRTDIPGFVSFNFTTKKWTNHTDTPYSTNGTLVYGTATYLPGVGPNGIIVLLGGQGRTVPSTGDWMSFETIHFLDPVTFKWFKQNTTGQAPAPRLAPCTVGVAGNDSYEIFVYGGEGEQSSYGDVHILTLPGFTWIDAEASSSTTRVEMGCTGAGNRNMIVVGGAKVTGTDDQPDKNSQGLGIFDMTALEWKTKYSSDAGAYETPAKVTKWYQQGGLATVQFSEGVEGLFSRKETGNNNNNTSDSGNNTTSDGDEGKPVSLSTGAIAGIVVGVVVGVALIATLIFLLLRRRGKEAEADPSPSHESPKYASGAFGQSSEASTAAKYPAELNHEERYELSVNDAVELPSLSWHTSERNEGSTRE